MSEEFHKAFAEETRIWQWTNEWYGFTDAGMAWLQEKGLEWVKVEAGPGQFCSVMASLASETDAFSVVFCR